MTLLYRSVRVLRNGEQNMILEVYDGENYNSWWDAEKNDAIYPVELKGDEISVDDIQATINVTEECIRHNCNIKWRLKE